MFDYLNLLVYHLSSKPLYSTLESLPPKNSKNHSYALCYYFLNKTSRSFARVIQELDVELRHPVAIFYLVLRALDTIEDDMTIDIGEKKELLNSFHTLTTTEGWNYQGNGKGEKDGILLKEYEVVIEELNGLDKNYRDVIVDVTKRMGEGMAIFTERKVESMQDFDLYTHYVAGLVGIGLTNLFQESGLEPELEKKDLDKLANEMGLFLQKVNILKDFLCDCEEGRLYWPEEVWKKYVGKDEDVNTLSKPENRLRALGCLNELCANALQLVPSCLDYLDLLQNKTVFHFAAIPQIMAMATFTLFYNNHDLFVKRGTKIRKSQAVSLIMNSTNIESVKKLYFDMAIDISHRARKSLGTNDEDKSFEDISLACANIVRWIQVHDKKHPKAAENGIMSYGMVLAVVFAGIVMFSQIQGVL